MRLNKFLLPLIALLYIPAPSSISQPPPNRRPNQQSKKNLPPPRHGRETLSLDGEWKYSTNSQDGGISEGWAKARSADAKDIIVPGFVNKFELPRNSGSVWLWHEFLTPARWKGQTVRLFFGAVSLHATVWLDGEKIGEHEGSSVPFEWNVTPHITPGSNQLITVRIQGSTEHGVGVWQHVSLAAHDEAYISSCFPQGGSTGGISAKVVITNTSNNSGDSTLDIKLFQTGDKPKDIKKTNQNLGVTPGVNLTTIDSFYPVKNLKLWSPDSPNLYHIGLSFRQDADILDTLDVPFGFRTIDFDTTGLKLNGKELKLLGVSEMPAFPRTFANDDDLVRARELIRRLKDKQINIIQLYAPQPELLQLADEEGLLVVENSSKEGDSHSRLNELKALIERDRAHPSIVVWNADGMNDADLNTLRDLDPSRLIAAGDAASPKLWLPGQRSVSSFAAPSEFLPAHSISTSFFPSCKTISPADANDKSIYVTAVFQIHRMSALPSQVTSLQIKSCSEVETVRPSSRKIVNREIGAGRCASS